MFRIRVLCESLVPPSEMEFLVVKIQETPRPNGPDAWGLLNFYAPSSEGDEIERRIGLGVDVSVISASPGDFQQEEIRRYEEGLRTVGLVRLRDSSDHF